MNKKILVLDEMAVNLLSSAYITDEWFDNYTIPDLYKDKLCSLDMGDARYILSYKATEESKCLAIKVNDGELFLGLKGKDLVCAFERTISFSLRYFNKSNTLTKNWGKFVNGNVTSFFATHRNSHDSIRLYFNTSPMDTKNIYLYKTSDKFLSDLNEATEDEFFIEAISNLAQVIEARDNGIETNKEELGNFGIELTELIDDYQHFNFSFQQWYDNKLTTEQRNFVDKDYNDPVRLKGAAGTGKTLAMVVKLIRDSYIFENDGTDKRILFLTHSHSTSEIVNNMISSMDRENRVHDLNHVHIKICSLYDLAHDILNYKNIFPISTDGQEGREIQYELMMDLLKEKLSNLKFKVSKVNKCSEPFKNYLLDENKRHNLCIEILNEFACILDAENIFLGSDNSKEYINGSRESWQMELANGDDRYLMLELHNSYRDKLKELNALSMDQMIADFSNHLRSHFWNRLRETEGFDAIFVDELHYFTKPERMVFNELCRSQKENGRHPLFMAYDVKQSTNDIFLNSVRNETVANIFKSTGVGASQLVELTKVFRYTPEIAEFLKDLDGSFPALDLQDEWNNLKLSSECDSGEKPIITIYKSDINLIDDVFANASKIARRDKSLTVAILCMNSILFSKYLKVGRIKNMYEPLTSRDDLLKSIKIKGKSVFSMPEYVAGMQFDVVFLIHVDKNELPDDITHSGVYRRFVSQIYLGASRAKSILNIACSSERRGMSQILNSAIENQTVTLSYDD